MKMKLVLAILMIAVGSSLFMNGSITEKDLYANRIAFLKSTNMPFTGKLEAKGKLSYYYENFCNGIPCGEWAENENGGGIIQKGKYLNKSILCTETRALIHQDTFVINHWQESELNVLYPQFLAIDILETDDFFLKDDKQYDLFFIEITNSILKDTYELKYDYIQIAFVNSLYGESKNYSREYEVKNGKIIKEKSK